jgi:hypothetical protein
MIGVDVFTIQGIRGSQTAPFYQREKKLTVMKRCHGHWIVILQRVEGMRVRGNDLFKLATLKNPHIFFNQELKKTFLSYATDLMS